MDEQLQWTMDRPTKPGAYFYRLPGHDWKLARVYWSRKELCAIRTGTQLEYRLSAMSGEWAGPIPLPEGIAP